ncbi:MAG: hypothetical protein K2Y29_08680 [Beijerinckiaceae bacterium]|nr:hypothetical protein [Beijerinckiaceae bacterium]
MVEVFVPVCPQAHGVVEDFLARLTARHGGATAFSRSPARGLWKDGGGAVEADDVIVIETMAERFEASFWRDLQRELERTLAQDVVLVRASKIALLKPVRSANEDA